MIDAVFVVGTGRSGTHFTCRALRGFANMHDPHSGQEYARILKKIANAAIYHRDLPQEVLTYYQDQRSARPEGGVFLDQHHPNLFFTDALLEIFDHPVFVYPERPVAQTVASMMQHKGVLAWYKFARRSVSIPLLSKPIPLPNRFLGVSERKDLFDLPLHRLCALRVLSHNTEIQRLAARDPRCRLLPYEQLVHDQSGAFGALFTADEHLALGAFEEVEPGKAVSLNKYKSVLDPQQIDDIADMEADWTQQIQPAN